MLRQGLYITVYIYTERCVIMQVFRGLTANASETTRIVIKYQLCVKTKSCVFNCKPKNHKNRNPENVWLFMALVKKGPFLWLFIAIKFKLSLSLLWLFMTAYEPCISVLLVTLVLHSPTILFVIISGYNVPLRHFITVCCCFYTILNYFLLRKSDVIKITRTHSMATLF